MYQSLQDLAKNTTEESRGMLSEAVLDIFFNRDLEPTDLEKELFTDVTVRLLQDVTEDICGRIANRIADSERTPRSLALDLARRDDEVLYEPVLTRSKVLTDDDLIEIVKDKTEGHRLSVANRSEINEKVTEALVENGEISVIRRVTENTGAKFDDGTLNIVVERAGSDKLLLKCLSHRGQQKVDASANTFFDQLKSVLQRNLGDAAHDAGLEEEFSEEKTSEYLDQLLKARMEQHARKVRIKAIAQAIRRGEENLSRSIEKFATREKIVDAVFLIAEMLKIPVDNVQAAYGNNDQSAFAMLCHSAGLSGDAYKAIMMTRLEQLDLDPSLANNLLRYFRRVNNRDCQRLVRLIRENAKEGGSIPPMLAARR
ncbi:MAG: DUF2336 domain-containing protein [Pseudomonadota bacterium]